MKNGNCTKSTLQFFCFFSFFQLWDWFFSAGVRMAICLVIKLVIHWSMLFRPYVQSSFCLSVTSVLLHTVVHSSSPVLLVTWFVQFFHGHNPFNLKLLKAILKHLKTFLHVLIFKLQCYRERLLLSPLI